MEAASIMHNLRFDSGATHLVVGPPAAGKTHRVCEILRNKSKMIEGGERIKNVVFCYAVWQPVYQRLLDDKVVTKFVCGKPTVQEFTELVKAFKDTGGSIVVLDDCMSLIDDDLVSIVTVHSRHYATSTFILFQSLFPANRLARQISLNVKYIHVHKNPRENAQFATLARQVAPKDYKWMVEAYHAVTAQPHTSFLLDMTQGCDDRLRFRSHYLPSELPMRVYFPSSFGTSHQSVK